MNKCSYVGFNNTREQIPKYMSEVKRYEESVQN